MTYGKDTKMNIQQFEEHIKQKAATLQRQVSTHQNHHTHKPNYSDFKGFNHQELNDGMRRYHINTREWIDIGQHFTAFPDGMILTGRDLELDPAGIYGKNKGAIMTEHLGSFNCGGDVMTQVQRDTIIKMNAIICKYFKIEPDTDHLLYHTWYASKSCPGTNFFGGNTRAAAAKYFTPLVRQAMDDKTPKWKMDMAQWLVDAGLTGSLHEGLEKVDIGTLGAILRNLKEGL